MKKSIFLVTLLFCIIALSNCSSSNDNPINGEEDEKFDLANLKDGINTNISPNADKPLTVYYKVPSYSDLFNYSGDLYAHTGVISENEWEYVPAEWNMNIDKCKMTKVKNNIWSITLSPTIRQWYNSNTTSISKLGFVFRNSDGTKKTADLSIDIKDDKFKEFTPTDIVMATLPTGVEEGINIIDKSTVTLVLYDKDKNGNHKDFALAVGDFNNWILSNDDNCKMKRDESAGCWWITLKNLDANKEYAFQYYVGIKGKESIRLGDPYCEKILDPDNDKYISSSTYPDNMSYPNGARGIASVFKINNDNYSWSNTGKSVITNPENMVIYELNLRDFTTSHDINGAMNKLSYIKGLGVNAVELMPVQEFDGNDSWGYNPCFYFAFDKAYGTKKMYKDFINKCHQEGLGVILDVVYNHATGNMPFAKLYWDSSKNKVSSSNPYFNVDAPHPYSVFNDFNHESPLVRKYIKRNLQFLLNEYHLDGFRFDMTKGFTQNHSTESTAANYDADRIAILKDYASTIKATNPNAVMILEHFCDNREESELANAGIYLWRNMNNAYCQSAMGYDENSNFDGIYTSTPSWVGFMESHDEERMAYKQKQWGVTSIKNSLKTRINQLEANTAFFLTVPGPKMIWEFGEVAYDYSINSDENGSNINEQNRTSRKPIKWEYTEDNNRKELYNVYSELMKLRDSYPDLFSKSAQITMKVGVSDWNNGRSIFVKSTTGEEIVVLGNFTDATTNISFPAEEGNWKDWFSNSNVTVSKNESLPAHSFKLYTRL